MLEFVNSLLMNEVKGYITLATTPTQFVLYRTNHARGQTETNRTYYSSQVTFQEHKSGPVLSCEHTNGMTAAQPIGPDGFRKGGHP